MVVPIRRFFSGLNDTYSKHSIANAWFRRKVTTWQQTPQLTTHCTEDLSLHRCSGGIRLPKCRWLNQDVWIRCWPFFFVFWIRIICFCFPQHLGMTNHFHTVHAAHLALTRKGLRKNDIRIWGHVNHNRSWVVSILHICIIYICTYHVHNLMYIYIYIQSLDTYTLYTPDIHLHVTMIIIMKIAMKNNSNDNDGNSNICSTRNR